MEPPLTSNRINTIPRPVHPAMRLCMFEGQNFSLRRGDVVLGKSGVDNNLLQINIIDLGNNQVVAVVCTDKGNVENKTFNLPDTINVKEVIKTSEIINKMLVGTPINDVGKRLELEVKPVIKNQIRQYETVYNIFYDAFNDFVNNNSNIHVTGTPVWKKKATMQKPAKCWYVSIRNGSVRPTLITSGAIRPRPKPFLDGIRRKQRMLN